MQDVCKLISSLVLLLFLFFYSASLSSQCVCIALFTQSAKTCVKTHSESVMKIADHISSAVKINIHDRSVKKIDICIRSAKESARKDLKMSFRKTFSDCLINILLLSRRLLYTLILWRKNLLEEIWKWFSERLSQIVW